MEIVHVVFSGVAAVLNKSDINGLPTQSLGQGSLEDVLKIVFGVAGGVALIMVVMGGLKYINSLGNAQNVAKAKDTILYAVIGLVVCILAYSIVGFVVKRTAG